MRRLIVLCYGKTRCHFHDLCIADVKSLLWYNFVKKNSKFWLYDELDVWWVDRVMSWWCDELTGSQWESHMDNIHSKCKWRLIQDPKVAQDYRVNIFPHLWFKISSTLCALWIRLLLYCYYRHKNEDIVTASTAESDRWKVMQFL